jgi:hypothetical protein
MALVFRSNRRWPSETLPRLPYANMHIAAGLSGASDDKRDVIERNFGPRVTLRRADMRRNASFAQ